MSALWSAAIHTDRVVRHILETFEQVVAVKLSMKIESTTFCIKVHHPDRKGPQKNEKVPRRTDAMCMEDKHLIQTYADQHLAEYDYLHLILKSRYKSAEPAFVYVRIDRDGVYDALVDSMADVDT